MPGQSQTIPRLERAIATIIATVKEQLHAVWIDTDGNTLTVRFRSTPDDSGGKMLCVLVDDASKSIGIPNILKPRAIEQRELGRSLIDAVRSVAKSLGYRLFIIDMVQSFHRKTLEWGAAEIDHETVEITDATRLTDVLPGHSTFKAINATLLSDQQVRVAHERFLVDYPGVLAHLAPIPEDFAKILGINLEDQRMKLVADAMADQARLQGVDAFDMLVEYAFESPSEREQILERREQLIRAAGAFDSGR